MKKTIVILLISLLISLTIVIFQKTELTLSSNLSNENETVIIIDAGHGGEDGGAVAADGTVEKDLNLAISLKLNDVLSSFGYKTCLIRDIDISIHDENASTVRERKVSDIHNRAGFMKKFDNCIYVSIHQNKYEGSSIWGAQTFYSPNNDESVVLADFIQESIAAKIQPDNNRVIKKSGTNIYLLYNATCPAVMVECGFLSNPQELAFLKNDEYQSQMAYAISYGIFNYFVTEVNNGTEV
ncbi:MAG: N-acetylmuramoyl-L-alanine amidase [Oscillospiraceae bacterium]|nr:N-acetylmuramoyl-L-alanine amidase [Oscillospiraceae bacterium]